MNIGTTFLIAAFLGLYGAASGEELHFEAPEAPLQTQDKHQKADSTIVYATVGRSQYAFDIYSLPAETDPVEANAEVRLTDGQSVNFNGAFGRRQDELFFVSERDGNMELYNRRVKNEMSSKHSYERMTSDPSMQDRPIQTKDGRIIFASTHVPNPQPRHGWTAIYNSKEGSLHKARRLTPENETDYSPALSPDEKWLAVASGSGKTGESDVVVMKAKNGSHRRTVAKNGGWPTFAADGKSLFFHRQSEDGWWSIYWKDIDGDLETRITPPGRDFFTPAAFHAGDRRVAVAFQDANKIRQIAVLYNGPTASRTEWYMTQLTNLSTHHYNPFVSPDGQQVGYHRCRCLGADSDEYIPVLERHTTSLPGVDLMRIDGSFPSFSDDDKYILYNEGFTGVSAVARDGSHKQLIFKGPAFGTSASVYDKQRVVATASGPTFATEDKTVHIFLLTDGSSGSEDWGNADVLKLTKNGTGNNAFPAFSSDGSEIVFRSGRTGDKNLYIMSTRGEEHGLLRLTEGPWDDTMPGWTPASGWIVFASSRNYVDSNRPAGAFDIFMVRPDGSGLRRVFDSHGGLANHPKFSPKFTPEAGRIVFTSDYAGYSAEEIALPHQFQPYGDLFAINIDGTGLQRLTHDPYENGTPTWGSNGTPEVKARKSTKLSCSFDDSVEWLRPKQAAVSKTTANVNDMQQQASSASFWCPFARHQTDEEIAPSR
ncbi:g6815 [Coccomyxa viridis]|uniref:G6815 protein n=1 Tax=Coccomyxa viridis TaxID=1274662 RepID=A0ABP1G0A4_9CHLO